MLYQRIQKSGKRYGKLHVCELSSKCCSSRIPNCEVFHDTSDPDSVPVMRHRRVGIDGGGDTCFGVQQAEAVEEWGRRGSWGDRVKNKPEKKKSATRHPNDFTSCLRSPGGARFHSSSVDWYVAQFLSIKPTSQGPACLRQHCPS